MSYSNLSYTDYYDVFQNENLPSDFFEKIVDLENKFITFNSLNLVNELLLYYKLGIEHYSDKDKSIQSDFKLRMHSFLTNKIVIKLMNQELDLETSVRNRSKTNIVKTRTNLRRNSQLKFNFEKFKLNENFNTVNWKEYIDNYNINLSKAIFILESDGNKQLKSFNKAKNKLTNKNNLTERKRSYMKRNANDRIDLMMSNRKSSSLSECVKRKFSMILNSPMRKLKLSLDGSNDKYEKKYIKNKSGVDYWIKNFIDKFEIIYYKNFVNQNFIKVKDIGINMYKNKINEFDEYLNGISEFNDMIRVIDEDNGTQINSILQLIRSLELEHEKKLFEIDSNINNQIRNIKENIISYDLKEDDEIKDIINILVDQLLIILK